MIKCYKILFIAAVAALTSLPAMAGRATASPSVRNGAGAPAPVADVSPDFSPAKTVVDDARGRIAVLEGKVASLQSQLIVLQGKKN